MLCVVHQLGVELAGLAPVGTNPFSFLAPLLAEGESLFEVVGSGNRVAANMLFAHGGIDASRHSFAAAAAIHASANTSSELWITETAFGVYSPNNAAGGGAKAAIDGMCRAADIAWNLDALGVAAEVGVDVFCRETLAGDWLEVIGLWQPGDARTRENNRPCKSSSRVSSSRLRRSPSAACWQTRRIPTFGSQRFGGSSWTFVCWAPTRRTRAWPR